VADHTPAPGDRKEPEPLTVRDCMTLEEYLDAGGDLTALPDLEGIARVIVISRHTMPRQRREDFAGFFWRNLTTWLAGESVEGFDGEMVGPSPGRIRHAAWLCQGLADEDVAERFEGALPEGIRAICWQRIKDLRG
jgi:hypothetical protein